MRAFAFALWETEQSCGNRPRRLKGGWEQIIALE